jgi:hypothetical protein
VAELHACAHVDLVAYDGTDLLALLLREAVMGLVEQVHELPPGLGHHLRRSEAGGVDELVELVGERLVRGLLLDRFDDLDDVAGLLLNRCLQSCG